MYLRLDALVEADVLADTEAVDAEVLADIDAPALHSATIFV